MTQMQGRKTTVLGRKSIWKQKFKKQQWKKHLVQKMMDVSHVLVVAVNLILIVLLRMKISVYVVKRKEQQTKERKSSQRLVKICV